MTDVDAKFSKQIGWTKGERTGRYAMVIDHGKVVYAEVEPAGDVTVSIHNSNSCKYTHLSQVSGVEAVMAKL